MREKIIEILKEMNEEIPNYKGDNLYGDGLLDSIQIIDLVTQIEDVLNIEMNPELVVLENFANMETIIRFVEELMEE